MGAGQQGYTVHVQLQGVGANHLSSPICIQWVAYGPYLAKGETSRTTMSLHFVSLRIVAAASAKARPSAAVVVVVPKLSDCATATAGEALTPVLRDNCGALATLRPP